MLNPTLAVPENSLSVAPPDGPEGGQLFPVEPLDRADPREPENRPEQDQQDFSARWWPCYSFDLE